MFSRIDSKHHGFEWRYQNASVNIAHSGNLVLPSVDNEKIGNTGKAFYIIVIAWVHGVLKVKNKRQHVWMKV